MFGVLAAARPHEREAFGERVIERGVVPIQATEVGEVTGDVLGRQDRVRGLVADPQLEMDAGSVHLVHDAHERLQAPVVGEPLDGLGRAAGARPVHDEAAEPRLRGGAHVVLDRRAAILREELARSVGQLVARVLAGGVTAGGAERRGQGQRVARIREVGAELVVPVQLGPPQVVVGEHVVPDRAARGSARVVGRCGGWGRLLRSDARKQERDDDDTSDRHLHTGEFPNPRGWRAGSASKRPTPFPGIGGPSSRNLDAGETYRGVHRGQPSASVPGPGRSENPGREDRRWWSLQRSVQDRRSHSTPPRSIASSRLNARWAVWPKRPIESSSISTITAPWSSASSSWRREADQGSSRSRGIAGWCPTAWRSAAAR